MSILLLICAIGPMVGQGASADGGPAVGRDVASQRPPADPVARERATRAGAWLKRHTELVPAVAGEPPIPVIAWKDPTLEPADPGLLAGYVITDTLWAAEALKTLDPVASREMERGLSRLGWRGDGLREVLFHPIPVIKHRFVDPDLVHGTSLGRFPIGGGRTVDLRVFHLREDPDYTAGHPSLFAEHAVYQALFDFWGGREDQARRRILDAVRDDRDRDPDDRIFWDDRAGALVDFANRETWLGYVRGERPSCRNSTFKLGALLYAVRLLGLESEVGPRLEEMRRRLWEAQWEDGGLAHFVEIRGPGDATRGRGATGEATAIAILSETVEPSRTATDPARRAPPAGD